jgi:hypothetical protein
MRSLLRGQKERKSKEKVKLSIHNSRRDYMTTPIQQKIRDKKRTPRQIIDMIKPSDWINIGSVGGDSIVLAYELAQRLGPGSGDLNGIEFWNYAMFYPYPEFQEIDPKQQHHAFQLWPMQG